MITTISQMELKYRGLQDHTESGQKKKKVEIRLLKASVLFNQYGSPNTQGSLPLWFWKHLVFLWLQCEDVTCLPNPIPGHSSHLGMLGG